MAKLYFYYSAMNAGKSTTLLQSAYNYNERGMEALIFTPAFDNRFKVGKISSRIGLSANAELFDEDFDFYPFIKDKVSESSKIKCILIDEAQFLKKEQVRQLSRVTLDLKLPVIAYGIRTDFLGEPFEGSRYLLAWADELKELKTICHCGKKATMNLRIDESGQAVKQGEQVEIGGNDRYVAVCRSHHLNEDSGRL